MKKKMFTIAAIEMALIFWVLESAIHHFIFEETAFEIIPSEPNELWMRIVIVFLIVLLGVFADVFISRIVHNQMKVARVYNSLIQASNQTLDNLLDQMRLFKLEAMKSKDFDRSVLDTYDNAITHATELIERLSNVDKALNGLAPVAERQGEDNKK